MGEFSNGVETKDHAAKSGAVILKAWFTAQLRATLIIGRTFWTGQQ